MHDEDECGALVLLLQGQTGYAWELPKSNRGALDTEELSFTDSHALCRISLHTDKNLLTLTA